MDAVTDVHASTATPAQADGAAAAPVDASLIGSLIAVLVVAGGLGAGARIGALALLVAVAVAQALFAVSWVFGTAMPGRKGALVIAAMAASGADVVVSVWPHGRLGTLLAVLGLAVPVLFFHQVARGAARTRIVDSLSSTAMLVLAVVALPSLVQLRHEFVDPKLGGIVVAAVVACTGGALIVGYLIDLVLPVPRFDPEVPRGMLGLVGATVVGGAVGYLTLHDHAEFVGGRSVFLGAALGAVAAFLAVAAAFLLHGVDTPFARVGAVVRPVCVGLLPLCVLAPGAFLLCLAIRA